MKCVVLISTIQLVVSLPVRGAWVEIDHSRRERKTSRSRSPCGERGLKYKVYDR